MGPSTAGYVLVGGRSSRFGSDKALATWNGKTLALWVAEQVREAAGSVTLVGPREKYGSLGLPLIEDPIQGFGPLAGLSAALDHTAAAWNVVVACDMPHVTAGFLAFLLRTAREQDPDVLLPLDPDGRAEPLCAVYAMRCREVVAEAIRRGVHKMTTGLAGLRVQHVTSSDYAAFNPDGRLFANLNTPADLHV